MTDTPDQAAEKRIEDRLDELAELVAENTKLLKAMRRDARIGAAVKAVFWLALIASSFYVSMRYIEPLLGSFSSGPSEGMSAQDWMNLLDQYKDQLGR